MKAIQQTTRLNHGRFDLGAHFPTRAERRSSPEALQDLLEEEQAIHATRAVPSDDSDIVASLYVHIRKGFQRCLGVFGPKTD